MVGSALNKFPRAKKHAPKISRACRLRGSSAMRCRPRQCRYDFGDRQDRSARRQRGLFPKR